MANQRTGTEKKMPNTATAMIGVLTTIAIISGTALGFTDVLTRGRIEANRIERQTAAVRRVLPDFENEPAEEQWVHPERAGFLAFPGRDADGNLTGVAIQSLVGTGYGGDISVVTGFTPEGTVRAVVVLRHSETPGLGARITEEDFTRQFRGIVPADNPPALRRDGGSIDAITAATVSSRAVAQAVAAAGESLQTYLDALQAGGTDE